MSFWADGFWSVEFWATAFWAESFAASVESWPAAAAFAQPVTARDRGPSLSVGPVAALTLIDAGD